LAHPVWWDLTQDAGRPLNRIVEQADKWPKIGEL
jgi:hypothetical protein